MKRSEFFRVVRYSYGDRERIVHINQNELTKTYLLLTKNEYLFTSIFNTVRKGYSISGTF